MQTSTWFDFDNAFQIQLRQGIALTCRTPLHSPTSSGFMAVKFSGSSRGFATRSRSVRCTCLTLGALLAAAIACRDQPPPPPPPVPQPPHDGVTLIQPGAAPRQTLRYHLTKG